MLKLKIKKKNLVLSLHTKMAYKPLAFSTSLCQFMPLCCPQFTKLLFYSVPNCIKGDKYAVQTSLPVKYHDAF